MLIDYLYSVLFFMYDDLSLKSSLINVLLRLLNDEVHSIPQVYSKAVTYNSTYILHARFVCLLGIY